MWTGFFILLKYYLLIGIIGAVLAIADKQKAKRKKRRISEKTLLLTAFIGGAVLMLPAMLLIRHKTKKVKFMILLPLFILLHVFIAVTLAVCYG